jgi:cell pole-organizing protein PopZ
MEEILASIRRIIADDEAKPAAAEKPVAAEAPKKPEPAKVEPPKAVAPAPAPAAKPPVMNNIPPSAIPAAQAAAAKAAPAPPPKPAPAPAPPPPPAPAAVSNSQDDIDAMLASLEAETVEPEVRAPEPPPEEDVFELTDEMAVPTPPPAAAPFRKVEPDQDLEFAEAVAASERQRSPVYDPPSYDSPSAPPPQQILSRSTVSAVESAFNSLANTVLSNNARTLEDLVKEMLRPMLKSWLDDNLPGLVERIVKAEIERVSRGGR